jgi:hypothetical protein
MHGTLEPLTLLLRLLSYALTLRAVRMLAGLGQRVRLSLQRKRHALVLTRDGLLLRAPDRDVVVPQEDILDIREQSASALATRTTQRWSEVFVVTHPDTGRLYLALPPIFGHSPRALLESLMRWRDLSRTRRLVADVEVPAAEGAAQEMPSRTWERVARGEQLPGVIAIRHGRRWLSRGPYASMLLGAAVLEGYLRMPAASRALVDPRPALLLGAAILVMPVAWLLLTRARLRARQNMALVLTPGGILMRAGRGSVTRTPWQSVARVEVHARTAWSWLRGAYDARTLLVHRRRDEGSLTWTEQYLEPPIEVVAGLCEAYRKQLQPPAPLDV